MNLPYLIINEDLFQVPQKSSNSQIPGGGRIFFFFTSRIFLIIIIFSCGVLKCGRKICARRGKGNLTVSQGKKGTFYYFVP